ncbi:MAG: hypothetical protein N4A49_00935 [Marinifilaceae bacterium]|jgi:hypothetical protein|nr:hypothetical protein [Marinifilaceae bacterium]
MKKKFKYILISIFSIAVLWNGLLINKHLKTEYYFPYNNGIKEKAFLNVIWKMSINEVERVNGSVLKPGLPLLLELEDDLTNLLSYDRFKSMEGDKINIGGELYDVDYHFFDNSLFRISLYSDVENKIKTDSVIISLLTAKYGNIQRDTSKEYSGVFRSENVIINYNQWDYNNDKNDTIKRVGIELNYLPMLKLIKTTGEKKQDDIF